MSNDEPMDDVCDSTVDDKDLEDTPVSTILRPGSIVMMHMSQEDYDRDYWPKLRNAINQLLTLQPGEYVPISYEQMYSCVYKCVCKQFSDQLYQNLIMHISQHLQRVASELETVDQDQFVLVFNKAMNQYMDHALRGIVPIFNYMSRFYIESKLKTDLRLELCKLFTVYVAEKHISRLIGLLVEAQEKPFSVPPAMMSYIIRTLHSLKPEFAKLEPNLFAKYIPNVLPPSSEDDLPMYVQETQQLQQMLLDTGVPRGDQSRKRPGDDSVAKGQPLCHSSVNHNHL